MPSRIIQFGTFQADLDSGELFKDGIKLKLGGQPFQVLELLLSRPGEVVTRDELRAAVWQADSFGDFDHGLNTAINKIREALGDSATNPRFVETVPRRGYRFIAPVNQPVPAVPVAEPAKAVSRKWSKWILGVAAGLVVALGLGFVLSRPRPAKVPVEYKLTQVTRDSGLTHQPSISGDGNFVVYSSDRATGKDMDIWIQHVSGGQAVRLTASPADEQFPSLSADGSRVSFRVTAGPEQGIYVIPALGGSPKLLVTEGLTPRISPNGKTVVYATGNVDTASEIRAVSSEGGSYHTVATGLEMAIAPTFTPDGRQLIVWSGPRIRESREPYDFWIVPAAGGTAVRMGVIDNLTRSGVQFNHDGGYPSGISLLASASARHLVISARSGDSGDLWLSPLSAGKDASPAIRVTVGAGAGSSSIAAEGRIAFERGSMNKGLWMLPIHAATGQVTGEMRRVWPENVNLWFISISADGAKIVYVSNRGGDPDIWLRDLKTGENRQLTASKVNEFRAVISPDGSQVAYGVNGDFYTMASTGGAETLVCKGCGANVVAWSPDGTKLLFYRGKPGRHATFDLATGQIQDAVWHSTADIFNGRISPDGKWLAFTCVTEAKRPVVYIAKLDGSQGGKPESWIPIAEGPFNSFWSPDGNLLYFHSPEQGELAARKLHPETRMPLGDPFIVQRFQATRQFPLFSAKGMVKDALYFVMSESTSNIWLADPVGK